jgi:hypothetical protein
MSDIIKNGELYESVNIWKQLYKTKFKPYTYTITAEEFNDLNSNVDTEIIYTYNHEEKIYILKFNEEFIALIKTKVLMEKELKNITLLVNDL